MKPSTEIRVLRAADLSELGDDQWEPLMVEGRPIGEAHWLRREVQGERSLGVGFWRSLDDCSYDYVFEGDETLHVLEGTQRLELETGQVVVTGPGDSASFPKGMRCKAHLASPFLEFFVISS